MNNLPLAKIRVWAFLRSAFDKKYEQYLVCISKWQDPSGGIHVHGQLF